MNLHTETFRRKRAAARRLAMLMLIDAEPDRCMLIGTLRDALEYGVQKVDRDTVVRDGEFLNKAGLVTLEQLGDMPALAITQWGRDVLADQRQVEGVQRPPLD